MTLQLPPHFLRSVAPRVGGSHAAKQAAIIAALDPVYQATLIHYGIDTDFRCAYFTGQAICESDQLCTTEEYASGVAYEGREDLGNEFRGDGPRYKGRGIFQLTGRVNYAAMGRVLGLDLINHPELAAEPVTSLKIACLYWQRHGLNALADAEDLETITRRINGGLNGFATRSAATERAFAVMGYMGR